MAKRVPRLAGHEAAGVVNHPYSRVSVRIVASAVDSVAINVFTLLMQIESLKVFRDLVETESFTKAAQLNQVTQSAVSQQISALERLFNSLLIERSKKNFRLTREGHLLYEGCKQIVQSYDLLQSKIQEIKGIVSGTIRVATIYSIGLHELPPYIKKLLRACPTVNVHVAYRRANQVYEDVLGNVVDMGLVSYPERDGKLDVVPLWKDKLVLICHPQNHLGKNKSIRLSEMADQNFINFEPDIPTRKAVDKILKEHGVAVRSVMEFDNIETVKRAVEIDAGVSIVPEATISQELAKRTLTAVEFQDDQFFRPSAAIYKKNKVLSPAMKQFLAILKQ
jgi:LysR family transcriptional regulator, transcriptional activator of the cysJI operon